MALGAHEALGSAIDHARSSSRARRQAPRCSPRARTCSCSSGAHPLPDERSLAAGAQLLAWVDALPPQARPLFLISGGASSLVEVLRRA